ncbi:hypothetical protein D3C86_1500970 [compost metagenome]
MGLPGRIIGRVCRLLYGSMPGRIERHEVSGSHHDLVGFGTLQVMQFYFTLIQYYTGAPRSCIHVKFGAQHLNVEILFGVNDEFLVGSRMCNGEIGLSGHVHFPRGFSEAKARDPERGVGIEYYFASVG